MNWLEFIGYLPSNRPLNATPWHFDGALRPVRTAPQGATPRAASPSEFAQILEDLKGKLYLVVLFLEPKFSGIIFFYYR